MYRIKWFVRKLMLPHIGKSWKQTEDALGCVTEDGKYVSYGKEFHMLYFIGRLK